MQSFIQQSRSLSSSSSSSSSSLSSLGPGRLGLGGSSGGYTYHGYTTHASPRTCGARLGQIVQELVEICKNSNVPTFQPFLKLSGKRRNDKTPLTFQPSHLPAFFLPVHTSSLPFQSSKPSNLSTFQPSNLPTFQLSNLLALQPSNLTTLHFFSYFQNQKCLEMGENVFSHFQTLFAVSPVSRHFFL